MSSRSPHIAKILKRLFGLEPGETVSGSSSNQADQTASDSTDKNTGALPGKRQEVRLEQELGLKGEQSLADDSLEKLNRWAKALSRLVERMDLETDMAHSQRGEYTNLAVADEKSAQLVEKAHRLLGQLAANFNDQSLASGQKSRVRLAISRLETSEGNRKRGVAPATRFRVMTATRCLSIKSETGRMLVFLLPATASYDPENHESLDNLKLSINLRDEGDGVSWTVCGLPITDNDILFLSKALLRDLVVLSCLDFLARQTGRKFEHADNIHRIGITRGFKDTLSVNSEIGQDLVRDLVIAQQNTVQKLLRQQEELQAQIGRDLHDSILSDVMMLIRRITSTSKFDREQTLSTLDSLTESIREICHGLVPRDLKDWGLEVVLEDLVDKTAERLETDISFVLEGRLPDLPAAVELHIFRIVQEALNNIEKYASAKTARVSIAIENSVMTLAVEDDGKGFDTGQISRDKSIPEPLPEDETEDPVASLESDEPTGADASSESRELESEELIAHNSGGFGLPSLTERVEIIKAYYPTRFELESAPGKGTRLTIMIQLDSSV